MSESSIPKILVGVTGGIAAYKSCELVRRLMDKGAQVRVVLSSGAEAFVTPLTFQALSGNPVHTELLDSDAEAGMGHIELARWADQVVIAPATANFIARLAAGRADDLLSTLCLATKAPIAIAPSMNQRMWSNTATQSNLTIVEQRGIQIIGPDSGDQACGDVGLGRMSEPQDIIAALWNSANSKSLSGKKVVITAGPTRETIDPVRYLSNYSSGKMGYALAMECAKAGANTILISGPVGLASPHGVQRIDVESTRQMYEQTMAAIEGADIFIAAAAVSDYRAETPSSQKIKKTETALQINLVKNPDILAEVSNLKSHPYLVGFAAESENLLQNAKSKLDAKNLDLIVANDISIPGIGFQSDENAVSLLTKDEQQDIAQSPKRLIAAKIVEFIVQKI
jgi:phosphopantothenoylcysteine decarboxylase/phosphopantothenate--cysteine ligase